MADSEVTMIDKANFNLPELPPSVDIETKPILRALANAHRFLAELKKLEKIIIISIDHYLSYLFDLSHVEEIHFFRLEQLILSKKSIFFDLSSLSCRRKFFILTYKKRINNGKLRSLS